jgi:helicase
MISNPERGIELELIISKIKKINPAAQLGILMGGGSSPDIISRWLDIPVLEETRRPVDLRLGVLFRGTFHFRGFNNHDEGDERWLEKRESDYDSPIDSQTISAIRHLAERGEQTIIFTSTRRGAVGLARYLAKEIHLESAKSPIAGLDDLAPSIQNDILGECLFGGIAFHHAELDQSQREIVESGFKCGEIKVLVSTTTLAWGVNLPAKNVFIEGMKYAGSRTANCKNMMIPLTSVDFTQAAGRAGRVGYADGFGRAILTANSPLENEILWDNYIYGESPAIPPAIAEIRLSELLTRLISCGVVGSIRDMRNTIDDTFWARGLGDSELVIDETLSALEILEKGGLIKINTGDLLSVTQLGTVLSSSGFSAKSIVDIFEKSREHTLCNELEWLHFSLGLSEWRETCGNYFIRDVSALTVFQRLNDLSGGELERSDYLAARLSPRDDKKPDRRGFEVLFTLEWISGRPVRDLETCFNRGSGGLRQDALTLCWILKTIARVLEIDSDSREENRSLARELSGLATRLKYGLPEKKLALAKALDIDREFINRLFGFGITGPRDFENTDYTLLENILPRGILFVARDRIKNLQSKSSQNIPGISDQFEDESPFTGKNRRLRRELKIRGISFFLQPKLYSYFRKLWWGAKSGNPWIHKDTLEPGINQPKYISKLRRELRDNKIDVKIISDGAGNYRLLLPEGENSAVVAGSD